MDAPNTREKVTTSSTPFRVAARNWRTSSARRAAKLGRVLADTPSIDIVEAFLLQCAKTCAYCCSPVDFTKKRRINLDHALPISRGGTAVLENLVVSCGGCNRAKGEMTADEFRALRALVATWPDAGKNLMARLKMGFYR